jgi:hypothetical protein
VPEPLPPQRRYEPPKEGAIRQATLALEQRQVQEADRVVNGAGRVADVDRAVGFASIAQFGSHMTPRWRRQSRANPSLETGIPC